MLQYEVNPVPHNRLHNFLWYNHSVFVAGFPRLWHIFVIPKKCFYHSTFTPLSFIQILKFNYINVLPSSHRSLNWDLYYILIREALLIKVTLSAKNPLLFIWTICWHWSNTQYSVQGFFLHMVLATPQKITKWKSHKWAPKKKKTHKWAPKND